jgi:urease accessory protein
MDDEQLPAFLISLQLADSAFPAGRYTLSAGLESFAQAGHLVPGQPVDRLVALLADYLEHAVGPTDGAALACAHRAVSTAVGTVVESGQVLDLVARVDERLTAVRLPREARDTSARVGRALLRTAGTVFEVPLLAAYGRRVRAGQAPGNAAVLVGLLTAALGVPRRQALACELSAFTTASVTAAVRLALIDHTAAQVTLHRLHPVLGAVTAANLDKDVSQIASSAPLIDLMGIRHERADLRLFAS